MKTLILSEKNETGVQMVSCLGDPKLGTNWEALKKTASRQGYVKGINYTVTFAKGHLFEDLLPKDLKADYKLFNYLENPNDYKMPDLLNLMKRVPSKDRHKARQVKIVRDILKEGDFDRIIIATDADAEGERIGRELLSLGGNIKVPVLRLWNTGSFKNKTQIDKCMSELKPLNDNLFERLYFQQTARSNLDYLTGMKLTKVLTETYNAMLPVGRMKAVIVSIVASRELERKHFKPKPLWYVNGYLDNLELKHYYNNEDGEETRYYFLIDSLNQSLQKMQEVDFVGKIIKNESNKKPSNSHPLPLSGTDFQSEMMSKYKVSLEDANNILQVLRDEGYTGYQGTNGRYFSKNDAEEVKDSIKAIKSYFKDSELVQNAKFDIKSKIFDDKKAEKQNHTPLNVNQTVPTEKDFERIYAKTKVPKLKEGYELIAKRIIATFLEDDLIENQSLVLDINGNVFKATGSKALKQGWRTFLNMEIKDTTFNTSSISGNEVQLTDIKVEEDQTKKPAQLTLKSLLDLMLNINKEINRLLKEETDRTRISELKAIAKTLKNAEGIGTDRTRGEIIKECISFEYFKLTGKEEKIEMLPQGWVLNAVLPPQMKTLSLCANWESAFEDIRNGDLDYNNFISSVDNIIMNEMIPYIINNVGKLGVKPQPKREKQEIKETSLICPLCNAPVIETEKVIKCSKNSFKNGKTSGCKLSIFKQNKNFDNPLDLDTVNMLFNGVIIESSKGKLQFNKENKYFFEFVK